MKNLVDTTAKRKGAAVTSTATPVELIPPEFRMDSVQPVEVSLDSTTIVQVIRLFEHGFQPACSEMKTNSGKHPIEQLHDDTSVLLMLCK